MSPPASKPPNGSPPDDGTLAGHASLEAMLEVREIGLPDARLRPLNAALPAHTRT